MFVRKKNAPQNNGSGNSYHEKGTEMYLWKEAASWQFILLICTKSR